MGDPFFDLANFSTNHDLTEDDDRTLLRAYLGPRARARLRPPAADADHVRLPRGDVGRRPAGARTPDADYVAYADRFFARLRERAPTRATHGLDRAPP